jgi:hypothetical protein
MTFPSESVFGRALTVASRRLSKELLRAFMAFVKFTKEKREATPINK